MSEVTALVALPLEHSLPEARTPGGLPDYLVQMAPNEWHDRLTSTERQEIIDKIISLIKEAEEQLISTMLRTGQPQSRTLCFPTPEVAYPVYLALLKSGPITGMTEPTRTLEEAVWKSVDHELHHYSMGVNFTEIDIAIHIEAFMKNGHPTIGRHLAVDIDEDVTGPRTLDPKIVLHIASAPPGGLSPSDRQLAQRMADTIRAQSP